MAGGPIGYILALKIDISYTIIKFPKIVNLSLLLHFVDLVCLRSRPILLSGKAEL